MKQSIIILTFLVINFAWADGYKLPAVDMPSKKLKARPQEAQEQWENSYRVQDAPNSDRELASENEEAKEVPVVRNPSSGSKKPVEKSTDKERNPSSKNESSKAKPETPVKERVKFWKYNSPDRY